MKIKLSTCLITLFISTLLINNHACAQAKANAKLEHFRITLVDLDLTDGRSPAISYGLFNDAGVGVLFQDAINTTAKIITDTDIGNPFPTRALSSAYNNGISFASASSTGSVFTQDGLTALLNSSSFGSPSGVKTFAQSGMSTTQEWFFLSPHSSIEFSGDTFLQAERSKTPSIYYEAASGLVFMSLRGVGATDIFEYAQARTYSDENDPLFVTNSHHFNVRFTNPSNEIRSLQFVLGFEAATWSNVPLSMPESDTSTMLMAGLGVLSLAVRRAQKKHNCMV